MWELRSGRMRIYARARRGTVGGEVPAGRGFERVRQVSARRGMREGGWEGWKLFG